MPDQLEFDAKMYKKSVTLKTAKYGRSSSPNALRASICDICMTEESIHLRRKRLKVLNYGETRLQYTTSPQYVMLYSDSVKLLNTWGGDQFCIGNFMFDGDTI